MYILRRPGQRGFLIIGTLVSSVSTAKGGGPWCFDLGVEVKNVKGFSLQYFCLGMLFYKKLSGCKKHGNILLKFHGWGASYQYLLA